LEHEIKYVLPPPRTAPAVAALGALCRPDPSYPANYVLSLYYDNLRLDSLAEKVDSQFAKSKVRVRWYRHRDGVVDPGSAMLEHKVRLGTLRRKSRVPLAQPPEWLDGAELHHPALPRLPALFPSEERVPKTGLFPYLIVRYLRRRFVEPLSGSRVALDTAISVERVNRRFLGYVHPVPLDATVVEVKNRSGELPASLRSLLRLGARRASFSKYGACFRAALAPREGGVGG
jgi:hypothetical protein